LDFPTFVKAYAWIFYRGGGAGGGDSQDDSSSSGENADAAQGRARFDPARTERGRRRTPTNTPRAGGARRRSGSEQNAQRLGYGATERGGSRDRSRSRGRGRGQGRPRGGGDGTVGIGEEAELRRWEKRLGEKQMRRLERVFNEWAIDDAGDDGSGAGLTVEVRDLARCFKELGRDDVHLRELRAWCDEVDLTPGDTLSLADFAYAYHSMFVDAGGEGARNAAGAATNALLRAEPFYHSFQQCIH